MLCVCGLDLFVIVPNGAEPSAGAMLDVLGSVDLCLQTGASFTEMVYRDLSVYGLHQ